MSVLRHSGNGVNNHQSGKLHAILHICQKMNAERDLVTLLELIAREATRLMEADRASVFILDRDKNELWSHVALESEPIRFPAHMGIAGATVQTGETINVANVHQDSRFFSGVDASQGYQTHNLLAMPMRNYHDQITGAFEVLNKQQGPFTPDDEELLKALAAQAAIAIETAQMIQALSQHRDRLLEENSQLWHEVGDRFATQNLLGSSDKLHQIIRLIEQIRDTSVDVLITGESGTGKELVAKAVHYDSPRARRPLVTLNCAALPDTLVESELFGIEKGVATGVDRRPGKFEQANGGTLFLDEIGDLSLQSQAKILRVLQERMVERVGGRQTIPVDVRILAATNRELEQEVAQGRFREDLYYRLNVIHMHTPALREIPEDIPLLARHFLNQFGQEMHKEVKQLSPAALQYLIRYSWPGNVRQLQNEMKRLVVLSQGAVITEDDLSEAIRSRPSHPPLLPVRTGQRLSLSETVEEVEKRLIREALDECRHNQTQTAEQLGLSRQGLIKKLKRYGIKPGS
jgi:Nif-specific regulatory protein